MSSKLDKRFYYYLRKILNQATKLQDFILVHEIYLSTVDLFRFLFILQKKKYKCALSYPFTYIISCSNQVFSSSEYKKLHKKIEKKNPEDAMMFRQKYNQREMNREAPIIKLSAAAPSRVRSNSATSPKMLSVSLRDSVKNVVELLKSHQSSSSLSSLSERSESIILSSYNIKKYCISTALTFIDQQLLKQICIPDLPYLGHQNLPSFALIRDQQEKLRDWIMEEIESSLEPAIQVRHCINICKHLKKQRNYNSLLTILRAVEDSAKDILKQLPPSKQLYFQNLLSIYDPEKAYRNYRMYVDDKNVTVPCFPIFARDIFLIFEHNVLWLDTTSSKRDAAINEELIQYTSYHYRILKSSENLNLLGKIDRDIVKTLSFFQ